MCVAQRNYIYSTVVGYKTVMEAQTLPEVVKQ